MLAIRCTLLRDTFEGGEADNPRAAEWPPSWMRLFSALVAAADLDDPEDAALLQELESADPPDLHASLAAYPRPRSAWVPTNGLGGGSSTLPGRSNGERPWARAVPRSRTIWYRWPALELAPESRARLSRLCRRIPYFGRSTSPVIVELSDDEPGSEEERLVPFTEGRGAMAFRYRRTLRSPFPGSLDELRARHEAKYLRGEAGAPWEIGLPVDYGIEERVDAEEVVRGPYSSMVVLALRGPRLDGRHTARLTYHVRRAVMARASEHLAVLHGHHAGDVVQCAFLGLPVVGDRHSDGHLLGVAVALPDLPPDQVRVIHDALRPEDGTLAVVAGALGRLEFERLSPLDAERRAWALNPRRWTGPSRTWVTALPMVFDRFLKPGDDAVAHARAAVVNSGFPEPVEVVLSRAPLAPGCLDLAPRDTVRRAADRGFRPYRHVRVRFARAVRGPVVLGSMRHYGLGLCMPVPDGGGGGGDA